MLADDGVDLGHRLRIPMDELARDCLPCGADWNRPHRAHRQGEKDRDGQRRERAPEQRLPLAEETGKSKGPSEQQTPASLEIVKSVWRGWTLPHHPSGEPHPAE